METDERIKTVLKHQADILLETVKLIEYLLSYHDTFIDKKKEAPEDLLWIYKVIKDQIVLCLCKLFHNPETYSFNQLTQLLLKSISNKNETIINYFNELKKANKKFKKLDILTIRNTHVGHQDLNRTKKSLNWKETKELIIQATQIHNKINTLINKEQIHWPYNSDIINNILKRHNTQSNLFKRLRQMYKDGDTSLSINEFQELLK